MAKKDEAQNFTPEQQISFHNGALSALSKEREGLLQMLQIVEATMNGHMKSLQDLGVKFDQK